MTKPNETPLKPCPFCGAVPRVNCAEDESSGDAVFSVACYVCCFGFPWTDSSNDAVATWNRRADPAPAPAEEQKCER